MDTDPQNRTSSSAKSNFAPVIENTHLDSFILTGQIFCVTIPLPFYAERCNIEPAQYHAFAWSINYTVECKIGS